MGSGQAEHAQPVRASILAKWFVNRAARDEDRDVDPMKLQKLLYLAQSQYVYCYSSRLVVEPTQAWEYGPVVGTVYREYRTFDDGPIHQDLADNGPWTALRSEVVEAMESTWQSFSRFSGWELSVMTHECGPFPRFYRPRANVEIPVEEIGAAWPQFVACAQTRSSVGSGLAGALARFEEVAAENPLGARRGDPSELLNRLSLAEPLVREAESLYQIK
jgi:uncharacterized phage-associated protein